MTDKDRTLTLTLPRALHEYLERECDPEIGQPATPEALIVEVLEAYRDHNLGKFDDRPIDDPGGYEGMMLTLPTACERWFDAAAKNGRITGGADLMDFLGALVVEGIRRRDPDFRTPGRFEWESDVPYGTD